MIKPEARLAHLAGTPVLQVAENRQASRAQSRQTAQVHDAIYSLA